MRKLHVLGLALLLLLSACAPGADSLPPPTAVPTQTPAPAATAAPTPVPTVAASPWLEDYDTFWRVVEENYPYYAAVERITGVDLQALKEEQRATVMRTGDSIGLYNAINRCAKAFDYTGHLRMFDVKWYARVMDGYRDWGDAKSRYQHELLDNPTSRAFYHYKEPESGGAAAGLRSSGEATVSASGNLIFREFPEESAVYVELISMVSDDEAKDRAEMAEFFTSAQAKGYQNCIVDIRRNRGGNSHYGIDMVAAPNRAGREGKEHYALVRGGAEMLAYLDVVKGWLPLHPIGDLPVEALPQLNTDDLARSTHYMIFNGGKGMWDWGEAEPLFSGRFWLLVGPNNYSASEYFAMYCKDTGFATLVGETTGGDGVGINPFIYVLPNSGICIQFSAENGLNLDGSCNEEFGTTPDIFIEEGQDALQICLETIDKTQ